MPGRTSRFLFRLRPKGSRDGGREGDSNRNTSRDDRRSNKEDSVGATRGNARTADETRMPPPFRAPLSGDDAANASFIGESGLLTSNMTRESANRSIVVPPYRKRSSARARAGPGASTGHEPPRKSARRDPIHLSGFPSVPDPIKSTLSAGDTYPTHDSPPHDSPPAQILSELDTEFALPPGRPKADSSMLPQELAPQLEDTTQIIARIPERAMQARQATWGHHHHGYSVSVPQAGVATSDLWTVLDDREPDPVRQATQLLIWSITRRLERLEEKRMTSSPSAAELSATLALKTLRTELVQTRRRLQPGLGPGQTLHVPRKPNPRDVEYRRELPLFTRLRDRLDGETKCFMELLRESENLGSADLAPSKIAVGKVDNTLVSACHRARDELWAELGHPDAVGTRAEAALDRANQELTVVDAATDGVGVVRLLTYAAGPEQ